MSEPATSVSSGMAVAATIVAASSYIGIDPQALLAAGVGAVFGEPAAKELGGPRKAMLYFGTVIAAGIVATLAAHKLHQDDVWYLRGWALGVGMSFQVLLASFLKSLPAIIDAVRDTVIARIKKFGGPK